MQIGDKVYIIEVVYNRTIFDSQEGVFLYISEIVDYIKIPLTGFHNNDCQFIAGIELNPIIGNVTKCNWCTNELTVENTFGGNKQYFTLNEKLAIETYKKLLDETKNRR